MSLLSNDYYTIIEIKDYFSYGLLDHSTDNFVKRFHKLGNATMMFNRLTRLKTGESEPTELTTKEASTTLPDKLYLVTKKLEDGECGYETYYKQLFTCKIKAKKEKESCRMHLSYIEEIKLNE